MMAMSYGSVYVAKVAMGASDMHTVKAFLEAEAYDGPSSSSPTATASPTATTWRSAWISRRPPSTPATGRCSATTPTLAAQGKNPFQLDSRAPSVPLKQYIYNETRYTMLAKSNPEAAARSSRAGAAGCRLPLEAVRLHGARAGQRPKR